MHEPSEECIVDFWEKGILRKLPVRSSNPNFFRASSQLRDSLSDRTVFGKLLHDDFIRLFDSRLPALAPAYESQYRKKIQGNPAIQDSNVTEFYNSYGWTSKFKGKIADDHLGIELLFLTKLIDKYLVLDDEACRSEMRKEIQRYITFHILSWVPEWNNRVQTHANTLSFKGIGNIILACSEDILGLFSQESSPAVPVDHSKN